MTLHNDSGTPRKRLPAKAAKTYDITAETAETMETKQRRFQGVSANALRAQPIVYGGKLVDGTPVAFKFVTGWPHGDGRPRYAILDESIAKLIETTTPYARPEWEWLLHRKDNRDLLDIVMRENYRAEHVVWNLAHGLAIDTPLPDGKSVVFLNGTLDYRIKKGIDVLTPAEAEEVPTIAAPIKTELDEDTLRKVLEVQQLREDGELKKKDVRHLPIIRGHLNGGDAIAVKFVTSNLSRRSADDVFRWPRYIIMDRDVADKLESEEGEQLKGFGWSYSVERDAVLVSLFVGKPAARLVYELAKPSAAPFCDGEVITWSDRNPLNLLIRNLERELSPYRGKRGASDV